MKAGPRKQALTSGQDFYFTGSPCKRGHFSERRASNGRCESCRREYDRDSEYRKNYAKENPEKIKAYKAEYRKRKGKELYLKERASRDLDKFAEYLKQYGKEYRKNNKAKINLWAANRRSAKQRRTPAWLTDVDKAAISAQYERAEALTRETGVEHHVDHVIPLQGELASGLHVPANLKVITAKNNLKKSNSFEVAAA